MSELLFTYRNIVRFCLSELRKYQHQAYRRGDATQNDELYEAREWITKAIIESGDAEEFFGEFTEREKRLKNARLDDKANKKSNQRFQRSEG